jgi:penicillin-binding protein-related factor A (putative recombinase)
MQVIISEESISQISNTLDKVAVSKGQLLFFKIHQVKNQTQFSWVNLYLRALVNEAQ